MVTGINWWMIFPVLAIGLVYAAVMYYRYPRLKLSKSLKGFLFVLRFVVVALIAFLLLSPFFIQTKKVLEQPIVIVAQDNSASIVSGNNTDFYSGEYLQKLNALKEKLSNAFDVVSYTFGQELQKNDSITFDEQATDISAVLNSVSNTYYNRNVGAVVLLSDGINNKGIQPELVASTFKIPIHAVALGDTMQHPDLSIADVRYNKMVFNQTDFPVEIALKAMKAKGQTAELELLLDGVSVHQQRINVTSDKLITDIRIMVSATQSGRKKLQIKIKPLAGELQTLNNQRTIYIDVLNEQQKVLVLAKAPHPDLGAFQSVFEDSYQVTTAYLRSWKADQNKYSLIILHQLPTKSESLERIQNLLKQQPDASVLFVVGSETDLTALNSLQPLLRFTGSGSVAMVDAFPLLKKEFSLFSVSDFVKDRLEKFPPLSVSLFDVSLPVNFQTAIQQRIRGVETNIPLLGFASGLSQRYGFVMGTGIWKWRLADFQQNDNQQTFSEIVGKTINYLMVKTDPRRLQLFTENEYLLNEPIFFRAVLYNPAMEQVNDADLYLEIKHQESDKAYNFLFSRIDSTYQLNVGRLPAGAYSYSSELIYANEKLRFDGSFVVVESTLEGRNTVADHALLQRLSQLTGGSFRLSDEMEALPELLLKDPSITSTVTYNKVFEPIISLPAILALILLLLSLEWFLRKINGSY
jgi:hypothetical protein